MRTLLALAALALACAPTPLKADGPPDILIVVWDDVGLFQGTYGYPALPSTPTLDALAAQGVLFTRVYASPTCQPSRVALQTGHWWTSDAGSGCQEAGPHTPAFAEKFIPERLPAYESALFGKWHLGGAQVAGGWELSPLSQGYEWGWWHPANINACADGFADYDHWLAINGTLPALVDAYEPDFLLARWLELYAIDLSAPRLTVYNEALAHAPFHSPPGCSPFGGPEFKYPCMIARADANLAGMLAAVDLARTLVIVTGDNGTPPQIGGPKSKETCYEVGVRSFIVAAGAGVTAQGVVSDELAWIGDIYATAIVAGGGTVPVNAPHPVRSRDLGPILRGETWTPRAHVIGGHNWATGLTNASRYIVTAERWKLIQKDTDGDGAADVEELYDLFLDPLELVDVLLANGARADAMRATLDAEAIP